MSSNNSFTDTLVSVVIASSSSVAKVYIIGSLGYWCVRHPKDAPLIPATSVRMLSRLSFDVMGLPMIYCAIGSTLSASVFQSSWFVFIAPFIVIGSSFLVATALAQIPCFKKSLFGNKDSSQKPVLSIANYNALRIAASFPNIVAMPILILPSLCDFDVVHLAFGEGDSPESVSLDCSNNMKTMVFIYFFSFSLIFYVIGHPTLLSAGKHHHNMSTLPPGAAHQNTTSSADDGGTNTLTRLRKFVYGPIKQTFMSPPVIALLLGFSTALIPPARNAIFSQGGYLRFFGSALVSLSDAAPATFILVTAASLVLDPKKPTTSLTSSLSSNDERRTQDMSSSNASRERNEHCFDKIEDATLQEQPQLLDKSHCTYEPDTNQFAPRSQETISISLPTEPNIDDTPKAVQDACSMKENNQIEQPQRPTMQSKAFVSLLKSCVIPRSPFTMVHVWFGLARFVVTPAIICALLVIGDCSGIFSMLSISPLVKLVVLLNAALPGAMIVVVLLNKSGFNDSANLVAKVYLPSYLTSIVSTAFWTSVGLYISIPDENGLSFCGQ